jgi:hypothetical protein
VVWDCWGWLIFSGAVTHGWTTCKGEGKSLDVDFYDDIPCLAGNVIRLIPAGLRSPSPKMTATVPMHPLWPVVCEHVGKTQARTIARFFASSCSSAHCSPAPGAVTVVKHSRSRVGASLRTNCARFALYGHL